MNDPGVNCFTLLFAIIGFIVFCVVLTWLRRINEIADYLKRIADRIAPYVPPPPPPPPPEPPKLEITRCDCCHKEFMFFDLKEIEIGKKVCSKCEKFLKSK